MRLRSTDMGTSPTCVMQVKLEMASLHDYIIMDILNLIYYYILYDHRMGIKSGTGRLTSEEFAFCLMESKRII